MHPIPLPLFFLLFHNSSSSSSCSSGKAQKTLFVKRLIRCPMHTETHHESSQLAKKLSEGREQLDGNKPRIHTQNANAQYSFLSLSFSLYLNEKRTQTTTSTDAGFFFLLLMYQPELLCLLSFFLHAAFSFNKSIKIGFLLQFFLLLVPLSLSQVSLYIFRVVFVCVWGRNA